MAIDFYNSPESSEWLTDATNTSTIPISGELFTAGHVDRIADEISAIHYALGAPGFRGSNGPVWGTNETITTGLATSSLTSVVFASDISSVLTVGMIIAGAAPTTTGWRRITARSTFTCTVNSAFSSNLASEYAVRHGTVSRRIAAIESVSNRYPTKHIAGLKLSNNGTDPTNDIDIAAGSARDSTDAVNMDLAAAITKRLDAAWAVGTNQGGLDTGAIANTTYHVWLIKRSDTGVVDVLLSTSATSPTMPANYDYKQRIGAIVRSAGAILSFVHDGYDTFRYVTPIADVAATNPGTSAVTRTLTLPTGISAIAIVIHALESPAGTNTLGVLTALDETDTAPSTSFNDTGILSGNAGYGNISGSERRVKINTSAQIRSRVSGSSASVVDYITTIGWIERRVV